MGYITEDYYRQVYCGNDVDGIDVLIERASDIIDNVTMMRIGGEEGLARLSPVIAERVRRATAAEVEYLGAVGGTVEIETAAKLGGFSIGKFSVSGGSSTSGGADDSLSPTALSYLEPTGLLYRGF